MSERKENVPAVKVSRVYFSYHDLTGEQPVLQDLSFQAQEGEFLGIIGPSGCGKSTLLSLVAGLLEPEKGRVERYHKRIGYMLQQDYLMEWRTTLENVLLGPELQKAKTRQVIERAGELLEVYGLGDAKEKYPRALSGGMRQRVALIRTMLTEPELFLLDEPFSALDYQTRLEVGCDIYNIIRSTGKTAILITHDLEEAISMCDRILVLSRKPCGVKKELKIRAPGEEKKDPMEMRNTPEFQRFFPILWKELKGNEE